MTPETVTPTMVHPSLLLGNANSRFGLKRSRIDTMKASILEQGGVMVPLEVEPLAAPVNGAQFLITDGHYRHAASVELLKDHDGIELPIIIHSNDGKAMERLKRQTAFNYEREGLSPMDVAIAGKQMLDSGLSRAEVRDVFKRGGGRKGAKVQPLSNAALNMYISFLEFPKDIQKKIHEGIVGVGAAYSLTKKPRDKWAEIVANAEKEREAEIQAEEDREVKFEEDEKKRAEAEAKAEELKKEAQAAKEKAAEAAKLKADKVEAESKALVVLRNTEGDAKKKAEEAFKAAAADAKAAMDANDAAVKESQKTEAKLAKYNEQAEARKKKLEELRKGDKPAKPIGASQIDKAAKKAGTSDKVKLNSTDMRRAVEEWMLPGGAPKVQAIAQIIMNCFNSDLTNSQAFSEMCKVTGESTKRASKKDK